METNEQGLKYAGFWRRLGTHVVDTVIWLTPVFFLQHFFGGEAERQATVYWGYFSFFAYSWFEIFLVYRYGGTPGRLLLKTKIRKLDGSPVTLREAGLRYSVSFIFTLLTTIGTVISNSRLDPSVYNLNIAQRSEAILASQPGWMHPLMIVFQVWIMSEFVVMMLNKKRRAIHDFIAGTVILQDPLPTLADAKVDFVG